MQGLIKVNYDSDRQTVSGRSLHGFLDVKTRYNDWFERMKEYGFDESNDFQPITQKRVTAQGNETTYIDHQLTIDMAKEISMLQRTEKGKQARQYFLELEKKWNSPEFVMARAIKMAGNKILQLETKIAEDKPKVLFADAVSAAKTTILIGDLAKLLKQNGIEIGANRLFKWLRENNYLISRKGSDYNSPTQKAMDLGLFQVKETTITHSDGHISISKTTKVTGSGQQYFINKFIKTISA